MAPVDDAAAMAAIEAALAADASTTGPTATAAASPMRISAGPINLNIAAILDVALSAFSVDDPIQTGAHDPTRTGFTFQQLELSLGASVDHIFRFDANLVFGEFGVEVEEAYATTLGLPGGLQLRVGQFLSRFGRLNGTHPHTWSFVDQPLVIGKFFGPEGNRGLGLELSWLIPLPWYAEVIGAMGEARGSCCARSYWGDVDVPIKSPADFLYTLVLKQFWSLSEAVGLFWGVSAQFGPNGTGNGNRTEIYGTDLYLRYRPLGDPNRSALSLRMELMYRRRQIPDDRLADWGLLSELVWTLSPRWETGGRFEWVGAAMGKGSVVAIDPLDPEWISARHRTSAQLTFYPSHFSRIRLQANVDMPTWRDAPIFGGTLSFEVVVGAHGAHAY